MVAESRDELGRLREREAEFDADFVVAVICEERISHQTLPCDAVTRSHLVLFRFDLSETGES